MRIPTILFAVAVLCCGCERSDPSTTIVITGSSTVAPLAAELGRAFEASRPGTRIDVQSGGSSRGIADARDGSADIGMVSRALGPDEGDLTAHALALDGIALIVHADNPVAALTTEQIVALYRGEKQTWDSVGGGPGEVTVVNKAAGRSTLELFLHHFVLKASEIEADVVIGDNEQGVKTIAGNPLSIGYVSVGTAEYDSTHGVPIRALPLDGVPANSDAVRAGNYPLTRPLNLVTIGQPTGTAAEFIRFAQSEEADELVRAQYFVPIAH